MHINFPQEKKPQVRRVKKLNLARKKPCELHLKHTDGFIGSLKLNLCNLTPKDEISDFASKILARSNSGATFDDPAIEPTDL